MDNSGVTSHRPGLADGPIYLDAIMAANNETGVLQPITELAAIAHPAPSYRRPPSSLTVSITTPKEGSRR